ncbi:MAG TPA: 6-phosphogluconolactonase [Steroidobacteraceae bacterium]|nr:6-phosphogluconolactonase [Steroidobacteraceae bacterium]
MPKIEVRRFATRAELDAALADRLERAIRAAATQAGSGPPVIMLSGGHTPLPAYREVARRRPQHSDELTIIYSDDRYVPADSDASNYHATRPLLDALDLPEDQVLRVRTELPLEEAARDYEGHLRTLLDSGARIGLALLGIGPDGHTASLFRPEHLQQSRGRMAIAVQRPDGMQGISVTPEFLSHVSDPLFVVAGSGKHDAIAAFIRQDPNLVALRAVAACPRAALWIERAAELEPAG